MSKPKPLTVEEALARYREAFAIASTSVMRWDGSALHIPGGFEYVAAFEALAAARERARKAT